MSPNTSTLVLRDVNLIRKTTAILDRLPEYHQADFFDLQLRQNLVASLELESSDWQSLFSAMRTRIGHHGFVVVRDLPFDQNNRLSVAMASVMGTPIAHNGRVPDLVREITPRRGEQPLEDYPHTDSPHWLQPNDMIALECKVEDQHLDVYSRIVPIWEVEKQICKTDKRLWDRLYSQKYPFVLLPEEGDEGYQMQPVLTRCFEGGHEATHVRFCLTDAKTCVAQFDLDGKLLDDLRIMEDVAAELGANSQFPFYQGDWLVFDNKRVFHSKTSTSPDSQRVLKKIKLQIDRETLYVPGH